MNTISKNDKKLKQAIWAVSIVIPIAVAILFTVKIEGLDLGFLPPIYASLNALAAIGLIVAIIAIKKKNRSFIKERTGLFDFFHFFCFIFCII